MAPASTVNNTAEMAAWYAYLFFPRVIAVKVRSEVTFFPIFRNCKIGYCKGLNHRLLSGYQPDPRIQHFSSIRVAKPKFSQPGFIRVIHAGWLQLPNKVSPE